MRASRAATSAAIAAVAIALAAAGAAVNLHMLEPRRAATTSLTLEPSTTLSAPSDAGDAGDPGEPGDTTTVPAPGTTTAAPTSETTTSTTATTTGGTPTSASPPPTAPPDAAPRTYSVGAGGTVALSVRSGRIVIEAVSAAAGWSAEIDEQSADEVEISFRGESGETSLRARLEGGRLSVEIESSGEPPDD